MVLRGFVTIWSLATPPTRKSPFSLSATTLGRTRLPLSVGTTRGMRLRTCATQVFVVPRSMPRMGFSREGEPGMGSFYHTPDGRPPPGRSERGVVAVAPLLDRRDLGFRFRLRPEQRRDDERPLRCRSRPEECRVVCGRERRNGRGILELPPLVERRIAGELLHEARGLQHHPLAVARRGHERQAQVQVVLRACA